MSASDKKKLRAAERAEKLTEKQLAEQKEAKKLKTMTVVFVAVLALMLVFAVYTGITKTIEGKGIRENKTVAVTVGDHEISNAELNYYFIDSVNNFINNYGSYISLFGLDTTKPLNEQVYDEESGITWADDFLNSAIESVKAVYTLNDAAAAAGFSLTEEDQKNIDAIMENTEAYALYYYGYPSVEDYLKAVYGRGASEAGYRSYCEMTYTADAFQNHYANSLVYEEADLREAEAANYNAYSSYSFNYYYLATSKFDNAAAAEEAAKSLVAAEIDSVEAFDAAIAALSINAETTAASTASDNVLYNSINTNYADWITNANRKSGDMTYVASTSTSTDENGNETTTTNGYYVVMFRGSNDNNFSLVNVRHILAAFEGGTADPSTGMTTYSDDEKAAAKAEAEALLEQWKNGDKTEESFAVLANENSDDGDGTTGGLYENVYPGQMVATFNDWCFDGSRKVGDTDIVETNYGYHVMYFSGNSNVTYRDFMIKNDLTSADVSAWYTGLMEGATSELGQTDYIPMDLVLSTN